MNESVIHSLMTSSTLSDALDVMSNESVFFSVDHSEEDECIVESCEGVLKTGRLSAEWVYSDDPAINGVNIRYGEKVVRVPFSDSPADRHITLLTLNQILAPEFEIRLCIDSDDIEYLTFLPLSAADWATLEKRYGPQLHRRFYTIKETPRLFVDALDRIKP